MNMFFIFFMVPVFTALFMYHRGRLVQYLRMIIPSGYRERLPGILQKVTNTYFQYIKGMLLMVIIIIRAAFKIDLYLRMKSENNFIL
ncbi:MAG: AI-2E family transporter [Chitinophagaceae bacterium]|nr:AI-2E family transporter [Chitinophagaceae bacterium]